ncbi:polysaccharide deacetylase family protein [bacterium]|nr:polysaccharide deacetylase family protein [bacterium]
MALHKLIYTIKVCWATLLYHLGILRLLRYLLLRDKAVVLMYHRVLGDGERARSFSHPGIIVAGDSFAMQMAYLREQFTVLTLDDFLAALHGNGPFPPGSCLITFDDGWLDNYRNALPIMQREGLPATVFLPVAYIGTGKVFWREQACAVLCGAAREHGGKGAQLLGALGLERLADLPPAESTAAIQEYLNGLKNFAIDRREAVLAEIDAYAQTMAADEDAVDRFIDWDQAREMQECGISFGSHGFSHYLLTQLDYAAVTEEACSSRQAIQAELNRQVRALSYPNGNYDDRITEIVAEVGYAAAFTVESGPVASGDDPYRVKRVSIHEDMTRSRALFLARILGVI